MTRWRFIRLSLAALALIIVATATQAQMIPGPRWYRSARGLYGLPPANASGQEIERLQRYLTFGVLACSALTAQQYAENRAFAGNMSNYLAAVAANAVDPQARLAAPWAAAAFASFPCAFPGKQLPVEPVPPPQPGDPPFALRAPDLGKVPDEEQETAADLAIRYDSDAAKSASAWKSAERMRLSLGGRGLSLNAQTATAVTRLQPLYEEAAAQLRAHKWDDALSTLRAAEATTQRIATSVGQ